MNHSEVKRAMANQLWSERRNENISLMIDPGDMGFCQQCGESAALVVNPPCPLCGRAVSLGFERWRRRCGWSGQIKNPVIESFCGIACMKRKA
jgi:hypothetical protein